MDRRSFLTRVAPIVVAPALALEVLEQARGKGFVGWTGAVEQPPTPEAAVLVPYLGLAGDIRYMRATLDMTPGEMRAVWVRFFGA